MINRELFGVVELPRPAPICSVNDLAMPSLAVLGFDLRPARDKATAELKVSGTGDPGTEGKNREKVPEL